MTRRTGPTALTMPQIIHIYEQLAKQTVDLHNHWNTLTHNPERLEYERGTVRFDSTHAALAALQELDKRIDLLNAAIQQLPFIHDEVRLHFGEEIDAIGRIAQRHCIETR